MVMFTSYRGIHALKFQTITARNRQILCPLREGSSYIYTSNKSPSSSCQLSTSKGLVHDEPLRILYCGSDAFSCASLAALHEESQGRSSNIASIDVVCREGKPYGRGLTAIRHRTYSRQLKFLILTSGSGNQGCGHKSGLARSPNQDLYWMGGRSLLCNESAAN
jgi:hypothetical protein